MVRSSLQLSELFRELLKSQPIFLSHLQALTPVLHVLYHCKSFMGYTEVKITSSPLLVMNSRAALAFNESHCLFRQRTGGPQRGPPSLVFVFNCVNIFLSRMSQEGIKRFKVPRGVFLFSAPSLWPRRARSFLFIYVPLEIHGALQISTSRFRGPQQELRE